MSANASSSLSRLRIQADPRKRLSLLLQDIPVADAKPADIQDLLGGALFKALYKWMEETGPVYLLPTGAPMLPPMRPLPHASSLERVMHRPFGCVCTCSHCCPSDAAHKTGK